MTVKKEATIARWIGLSTDTKPTTGGAMKIPVGATFYEYDTKNWYKTYDGTNWTILALDYGLAFGGTCNATMSASTTVIDCADLAGYGNDYFNTQFYMQVVKNANSIGGAPDSEIRKIKDYVSASTTPGRFTTDAFSANVEASDEIYILHRSIMLILTDVPVIGDWVTGDFDPFDVDDADGDNERWDVGYISAAAGGSAVITGGKYVVLADYDGAGANRYAGHHALPFYADYFQVSTDVDVTFGIDDNTTPIAVGIALSAGTGTWDANNYLVIERQVGAGPVDRIQMRSKLNGAGEVTTNVAITVDSIALKFERLGQTYAGFYSTIQSEEGLEDWVKIDEVEDPNNYMTNEITYFMEAFNGDGTGVNDSGEGAYDNFYYGLGTGGGSQYIAGDYDSGWVGNDRDGNVFERQEAIQNVINIGAAATLTSYEEDGSGANVFNTLIAVQGVTTGAGDTTTVVSAARTEGADYWNGHLIAMIEGANIGQVRVIVDDDGGGSLTIRPALIAASGDTNDYIILKKFETPRPATDSTDNYQQRDVVGSKDDTIAAMNTAPVDTDSIVTIAKNIMERIGATPADPDDSLMTIIGQRDATADTTAGTASHSALWNAAVAGLGLVDGGATGFEADGTGVNLYDVLVAYEGYTTGAGDTTSIIDTGLTGWAADDLNGLQVLITSGAAEGLVRTIVDFDGTSDLTVEPAMFVAVGTGQSYIITSHKSADWICGANNADNAYDSGNVVINAEGSILERLEYIQGMLVVGEGTFTTGSATEPIDTGRGDADNYWNGCLLMPLTGAVPFQPRLIVDYDSATDKFFVDPNQPFTANTGAVAYVILAFGGALAPAADQTETYTAMDVAGNKGDAVVPMPAATASLSNYAKAQLARGMTIIKGTVSGVSGTPTTVFSSTDLIGFGDNYFDIEFSLQLVQANAAANDGITREITTYASATGTFTCPAFPGDVAVGDEMVILHKTQMLLIPAAAADMTAEVPVNSPFARSLAVDGATGDYDPATMSQEALNIDLDKIIVDTELLYTVADADLSEVTDDSVIAQILAVDGTVADFDDNTDSLEAIRDKIDAIQGGAETLESLDGELDAMAGEFHPVPGESTLL